MEAVSVRPWGRFACPDSADKCVRCCEFPLDCGKIPIAQLMCAGVTQLVEYLLPKQAVAGSSPVARSDIYMFGV